MPRTSKPQNMERSERSSRYRSREAAERLESKLDHNHELLHKLAERMDTLMTTFAEFKAKLATVLTNTRANTTTLGSVKVYIAGINEALVEVKAQLAAAIEAGVDEADLEEASAIVDETIAATEAQAAEAAILANTGEEEETPPVDEETPPA